MNKQFPYYIEDWILWLGKHRDDLGNEVDFPFYRQWPIKLANYDVNFIVRSSIALNKNIAFTDRQTDTAVTIITKYKKQIKLKTGRDVDYVESERPLRLEIREIDRVFSVTAHLTHYKVKFPYIPDLVDSMHKSSNVSASSGNYFWMSDTKTWHVSKTERNLSQLRNFIKNHSAHPWQIDNETQKHFDEVDSIRQNIYQHLPNLDINFENHLTVYNSNESLDLALENFNFNDDFPNAAFRADNYGLHIGPNLRSKIEENYPEIATAILTSQSDIHAKSKTLNPLLKFSSLEKFMTTIRADYWVFLSLNTRSQDTYLEHAMNISVPGEKIFSVSRGPTQAFRMENNIYEEIVDLNTNNIVVFVDNIMLLSRTLSIVNVVKKPMLRIMYLQGDSRIETL